MSPGKYIKQAWREAGKPVSLKRFARDRANNSYGFDKGYALQWIENKADQFRKRP